MIGVQWLGVGNTAQDINADKSKNLYLSIGIIIGLVAISLTTYFILKTKK